MSKLSANFSSLKIQRTVCVKLKHVNYKLSTAVDLLNWGNL